MKLKAATAEKPKPRRKLRAAVSVKYLPDQVQPPREAIRPKKSDGYETVYRVE